jgi:hypothetical protein
MDVCPWNTSLGVTCACASSPVGPHAEPRHGGVVLLDLTTFTTTPIAQIPDANGIGVTPMIPFGARSPLDAVITGVILRYEDRDGHALAVDWPASVAYDAYLISARDGAMLWRARFDETQKPLLDNLLLVGRFLQGGGVRQTSDTLTHLGLERVIKTFPGIARQALP